ncbi:hypothetical protein HHK36_023575 [Tetracentron sinense]|uniref:Uncharacterized protein n=1 Tax=Tetracentron sinense TaxID=13715 RepID=A0A835D5I4_TETSI|nr:hypothetical protein HHK36_023575 [Tetracentron sinense]
MQYGRRRVGKRRVSDAAMHASCLIVGPVKIEGPPGLARVGLFGLPSASALTLYATSAPSTNARNDVVGFLLLQESAKAGGQQHCHARIFESRPFDPFLHRNPTTSLRALVEGAKVVYKSMKGPSTRREMACIGAVLLSNSEEPIEYFFYNEPIEIYCKDVDKIATQAQRKPLALTFTSVTVQTPTPTTTTTTAIFTSLE